MDYCTRYRQVLSGPLYAAATSLQVGIHCRLLTWGMGEESDRIENCRHWSSRQWLLIAMLDVDDVSIVVESSPLWHWEGDDLVIDDYPHGDKKKLEISREKRATASRENGKNGGRPRSVVQDEPTQTQQDPKKPTETQANPHKPCSRSGQDRTGEKKKTPKAPGPNVVSIFDEFWSIWENRKNKQQAIAAVTKLSESDLAQLVPRTRDYVKRRKNSEVAGQFVPRLPNAATYVNNRRWEDEFDSTPARRANAPKPIFDSTNPEDWK